ncbi:hypothetical protein G6F60_010365 [Rhizopus arrhizus]|nr:hypothetical protein G6F24_008539 [Rhizopus arrhizus]KAG1376676.1 hypothetical protein G6F61_007396 [Rhizopus arrhizus]KAG1395234.1 hypothetical protein G6F60_010365 [Rhizopus arrhizus]
MFVSLFDPIQHDTTLFNMFMDIPSPTLDYSCLSKDVLDFLHHVEPDIPGMKTTLYLYQKNSLLKILSRELEPNKIEKPEMIQFKSIDSEYYLNRLTGYISDQPEYTQDIKGGIICEDMGTGKTCLCLAAVMTTKDLSISIPHSDCQTKLAELQPRTLKVIAAESALKQGINWKTLNLPMDVMDWFKTYPLYYEHLDVPEHFDFSRPRRIQPRFSTLTVYVSNVTLIIVPDNLVAQWTGEIYKHVKDGYLNFTVHDNIKQSIPSPLDLIQYDLVIASQSRFAYENQQGGLDFTSNICQCPTIGSTRERACVCFVNKDPYVSPLLQVHWRRVIVDEGHRLSQKNKLSELSSKLFCHSRWICTGTPTQHLMGLYESDDLDRLGKLCIALGIQPFRSNRRLWHKWIVKPFLDRKPWALSQCGQMLSRIMIRHQKRDIEKEVSLPPLSQKVVYLEFDVYQWLAHNCQVAMISLNAILSQREGPDYLFSSKNVKSLRETVHNLWQSCFWYSIDAALLTMAQTNCAQACAEIERGLADYGDENEDLFRIKAVLAEAQENEVFIKLMQHPSPALKVVGLPEVFRDCWGMSQDQECLMSQDRVVSEMDYLKRKQDSDYAYVFDGHRLLPADEAEKDTEKPMTFYTANALSDAKVMATTSSKLNYLHYNEMVEIYLILTKLMKQRVLTYQEQRMTNAQRSNTILTFNTSDNANIILMPVRKAAYGIDLSSATRVYFVSPVWQTAMEQQAIKRAHRIGQTKPVYVETLVIRNTIEDELLKRRSSENSGEFFFDSKLRHILNHARFVPLENKLVLLKEPVYFIKNKVHAEVIEPERKKRRVVRFDL